MAATFTEFLREKAAKEAAIAEAGKEIVAEWRAGIERLFVQLRAWLAASDPDGIIQLKEGTEQIAEAGLGRYEVPRLDLTVFDDFVAVVPVARKTVGTATLPYKTKPDRSTGRVDITNGISRYILYRFPNPDGGDQWLIYDLRHEPSPLDQQAFERALMSYLR